MKKLQSGQSMGSYFISRLDEVTFRQCGIHLRPLTKGVGHFEEEVHLDGRDQRHLCQWPAIDSTISGQQCDIPMLSHRAALERQR